MLLYRGVLVYSVMAYLLSVPVSRKGRLNLLSWA